MIEKSQHSRVKIIFLLAIIALIALSFLSYVRINNLIDESQRVTHSQNVKLALEKIATHVINAETNQKSYLLTDDSTVLATRDVAFIALADELNLVDNLIRDNSKQIANFEKLQTAINAKLWGMKRVLMLYTPLAKSPEFIRNVTDGVRLTANIQEQLNTMQNEENKLLKVRSESFTKSAFITPLFTIVLIICAIIILIASYFKIMQELKISDTLKSEIKKRVERYHRMISEVKDYAILFLSKDGMIENWNKGAEIIKGYKAEEIIGKNYKIFYTEQDKQNQLPEKLLSEAKQRGTAIHEGWRLRKNGNMFWGSIVITAVYDVNNNIIGFSKVTRDLTDKKIAEDKIKKANKDLEQKNNALQKMNKELEAFNYISSHDLQEPLRQIQNFASRIIDVEQQNLSDKGKIYFEKMNNAANRMQTLIADLLAYSRTTTMERKFESTDLNIIIEQVKSELKEAIDEKNAIIKVGEMCHAKIIPFQFRQLMHNLIGNSLKFSFPDITPHIIIKSEIIKETSLNPFGDRVAYHISVSDNGIGFEPHYKDRIFEVFQRLHDKQKFAGTGIGLAIVKKIVENHNGIIIATSELNKGATFDIYIPESQTN